MKIYIEENILGKECHYNEACQSLSSQLCYHLNLLNEIGISKALKCLKVFLDVKLFKNKQLFVLLTVL